MRRRAIHAIRPKAPKRDRSAASHLLPPEHIHARSARQRRATVSTSVSRTVSRSTEERRDDLEHIGGQPGKFRISQHIQDMDEVPRRQPFAQKSSPRSVWSIDAQRCSRHPGAKP